MFSKAQVDINGLDELAEWRALDKQAALIDTDTFVTELTKGKELEDGEYRIRVPEFNHFCSTCLLYTSLESIKQINTDKAIDDYTAQLIEEGLL